MAKTRTRKTLYEVVTGKKPYQTHDHGIKSKPISEFISFKEAQVMLGHTHRNSTEALLGNGSIRFKVISPDHGMVRMIYKPDVLVMVAAIEAK